MGYIANNLSIFLEEMVYSIVLVVFVWQWMLCVYRYLKLLQSLMIHCHGSTDSTSKYLLIIIFLILEKSKKSQVFLWAIYNMPQQFKHIPGRNGL